MVPGGTTGLSLQCGQAGLVLAAAAISFATAIVVALATAVAFATASRAVRIGPISIVGFAGIRRVIAIGVVAVTVIAFTATVSFATAVAVAVAVPVARIAGSAGAVITCPAGSAIATRPTSATGPACPTSAAGAVSSRVAAICNGAATAGATPVIHDAGGADYRISGAWSDSRVAVDRTGRNVALTPVIEAIHSAESLRTDSATADFLALHDVKAAVTVHGWIGDSRYALRSRSEVLGSGRGADSQEEGCARQSKSV